MTDFHVPDMSCGHCVRAITAAVQVQAPEARVDIDLAARRVRITGGEADAATLAALIREAGYTPQPLAGQPG